VGLEGEVVDAHDARAGPAQRQEAVGRVDERGARPGQAQRPADLLPHELGPDPAAVLADLVGAEAAQRVDELARVAPPAAQALAASVARVDGDRRRLAADG
jgi:hypothetical protein